MADVSLTSQIIVPSAWDSATTTMLLLESMIAAIQTLNWDQTKDRMQELEGILDKTKLFR